MLTGAMLGLLEQLGLDIITLTEGLSEAEFFSSRLARAQVLQRLGSMTRTVADLPVEVRQRMPEIDWEAWDALATILPGSAHHPLQIWVAVQELTPMTVQRLKGYRKQQPRLFSIVP